MHLKSRAFALGLALLLCASQLASAQHAIGHLAAAPDHACVQCLHHAGQKHALLDSNPDTVATAADPAIFRDAVPARTATLSRPYRSRAPPISGC